MDRLLTRPAWFGGLLVCLALGTLLVPARDANAQGVDFGTVVVPTYSRGPLTEA